LIEIGGVILIENNLNFKNIEVFYQQNKLNCLESYIDSLDNNSSHSLTLKIQPCFQKSCCCLIDLMANQEKSMTSKKSKRISIDIGISESNREKIAEGLSNLLADSYTLYMMTHNFHWNVKGPQFNTLHTMFMTQYTEQWAALDVIAERIRALGYPAPGTYSEFIKRASIKEVNGVPKAEDMIRHLVKAQEATAKTARKLFPVVDASNDQPTADVLTQRIDVHEKTAWMLRSLLEE